MFRRTHCNGYIWFSLQDLDYFPEEDKEDFVTPAVHRAVRMMDMIVNKELPCSYALLGAVCSFIATKYENEEYVIDVSITTYVCQQFMISFLTRKHHHKKSAQCY